MSNTIHDAVFVDDLEFADNQQRTPCLMLLDTSDSVSPVIGELNAGIRTLHAELLADDMARQRVDLAIITFGNHGVTLVQDFVTAEQWQPPTLTAGGNTPMGEAINAGLDLIENRKRDYRKNGVDLTRPWVFLLTDGVPTDPWQAAAARAQKEELQQKLSLYAVGFGSIDMNTLRQVASPSRPPLLLKGLKFQELFTWLSRSLQVVSAQQVGSQHALPPVNAWATNNT